MHDKWKPSVVAMETVGFQSTLKYAIEDQMRIQNRHFYIDEIKARIMGDAKNFRIKGLEPKYRMGEVLHGEWMKGGILETELLTFPKGRNDDLIDALSFQLQFLTAANGPAPFQTPAGSWEDYFQKARRSMSFGQGFYHYGR
jgi:hypothetical protein